MTIYWLRGQNGRVLQTYIDLHRNRIIGQHWLWVAVERIAAGEDEAEVMADYGWQRAAAEMPAEHRANAGRGSA